MLVYQNLIYEDDFDLLADLSDRVGRAATVLLASVHVWDALVKELPDLPPYLATKVTMTLTPQFRDESAGAAAAIETAEDELNSLLKRSYRPSRVEVEELLDCLGEPS